jgi:hypothetical protein
MRISVVIRYIGIVLLVLAAFMLVAAGISYVNNVDSAYSPLVMSSLLTLLMGCFPMIFVPSTDRISQKEGFCIVVGAWLVSSVVGMFPYLMWGGEFTLINAWFESVSGFTTTGASILNDIEALPRGLQFWRMSSCWIGGVGVIMFALIILPSIGKSKMMLSNVELSSLAKDNFNYRTQTLVRIVLSIYVGLTAITIIALKLSGLNWFDSLCQAMSACSTCGFSNKNLSVGHFNSPVVELVLNRTEFTLTGYGDYWDLYTDGKIDVTTIVWSSSDEAIAKVENGRVTALGNGTAVITAEYMGQVATCTVHCTKVEVSNYELQTRYGAAKDFTLKVGDTITLFMVDSETGIRVPAENLLFALSKEGVITIDENGKIKAVAKGTVTVTVTYGEISLKCKVRVTAA